MCLESIIVNGTICIYFQQHCGGYDDNWGDSDEDGSGNPVLVDIIKLPTKVGILDNPYYDCIKGSLIAVDLFGQNIFRYSEKDNQVFVTSIPGESQPSFCEPVRNTPGTWVVGLNNTVWTMLWDGISPSASLGKKLFTMDAGTDHHTNNMIAGPYGAIYSGTFAPKLCGNYQMNCLEATFNFIETVLSQVHRPNKVSGVGALAVDWNGCQAIL